MVPTAGRSFQKHFLSPNFSGHNTVMDPQDNFNRCVWGVRRKNLSLFCQQVAEKLRREGSKNAQQADFEPPTFFRERVVGGNRLWGLKGFDLGYFGPCLVGLLGGAYSGNPAVGWSHISQIGCFSHFSTLPGVFSLRPVDK